MPGKTECAGVAIDANMMLAIPRFKVDVLSGIEELLGRQKVVVPKQVYAELMGLGKQGGRLGSEARIALELLKKRGVEIVEVEAKGADEALLKLAGMGFMVATNDKGLKKQAKGLSARVIYLRKKKFVEIG